MALSEEDEMSDMECIQAADASGQEFQSGPDQCEDGPGVYRSPCSQQISMREYTQQSTELTHQAVQELKASVAFKMHTQQCHSCGTSWFDGQWNSDCSECGEGAMVMPCPICRGGCGTLWRRNTDMSRSTGVAHWDGQCAYPEDRVRVLLLRNVITQPTEDELSEALGDLGK